MVGTQTVPRRAISTSVSSSSSMPCSTESAPARTASLTPEAPYEWIATLCPSAWAASTIAFISSNVIVCVVSTLSKLPRDP